jgi:hypothetical protein
LTKVIDTVSPEAVALSAAIELHTTMLHDDAWMGYCGTKEGFDNLYQELFVIARDHVSSESNNVVEDTVNTFFEFQGEIAEAEREVDWFLWQL